MVFSLSFPKGGEGWGEEAVLISRPSPRPSPRSFLTGRGRIFHRDSLFILSVSIRGLIEYFRLIAQGIARLDGLVLLD